MIAALARTAALAVLCWTGLAAAADPAPKFREFVLGNPKAKVTMIEYASLSCPHCAHFQEETYPKLKKDYIDTGKIKFLYRDFPLDGLALAGAVIARCVAPDKGHKLVEVLFAQQQKWITAPKPLEPLKELAKSVGISEEQTETCLSDKELVTSIREERELSIKTYQIDATPAFFIGDETLQGDAPYEDVKAILEAQLSGKKKAPAAPAKAPRVERKVSFTR